MEPLDRTLAEQLNRLPVRRVAGPPPPRHSLEEVTGDAVLRLSRNVALVATVFVVLANDRDREVAALQDACSRRELVRVEGATRIALRVGLLLA